MATYYGHSRNYHIAIVQADNGLYYWFESRDVDGTYYVYSSGQYSNPSISALIADNAGAIGHTSVADWSSKAYASGWWVQQLRDYFDNYRANIEATGYSRGQAPPETTVPDPEPPTDPTADPDTTEPPPAVDPVTGRVDPEQAGRDQHTYNTYAYPGTSPWEHLGAGGQGSIIQAESQAANVRIQAQVQQTIATQTNQARIRIAEINAEQARYAADRHYEGVDLTTQRQQENVGQQTGTQAGVAELQTDTQKQITAVNNAVKESIAGLDRVVSQDIADLQKSGNWLAAIAALGAAFVVGIWNWIRQGRIKDTELTKAALSNAGTIAVMPGLQQYVLQELGIEVDQPLFEQHMNTEIELALSEMGVNDIRADMTKEQMDQLMGLYPLMFGKYLLDNAETTEDVKQALIATQRMSAEAMNLRAHIINYVAEGGTYLDALQRSALRNNWRQYMPQDILDTFENLPTLPDLEPITDPDDLFVDPTEEYERIIEKYWGDNFQNLGEGVTLEGIYLIDPVTGERLISGE